MKHGYVKYRLESALEFTPSRTVHATNHQSSVVNFFTATAGTLLYLLTNSLNLITLQHFKSRPPFVTQNNLGNHILQTFEIWQSLHRRCPAPKLTLSWAQAFPPKINHHLAKNCFLFQTLSFWWNIVQPVVYLSTQWVFFSFIRKAQDVVTIFHKNVVLGKF